MWISDHGIMLRTIEERDLENIRNLRNDHTTWPQLSDPHFISAEQQRRWFKSLADRPDKMYFVARALGIDFVGMVRTDEYDKTNRSIRIGADVVASLRGRGFGRMIYKALKQYCFDILNMHRVWLAVLETNKIGRHLYKSEGFKEEGRYRKAIFRDGRYVDYILMSILEEEYRDSSL